MTETSRQEDLERRGTLPRHFVFLLVPEFSLMPFTAAVEPLRVANRMHGGTPYSWSTASADGLPVRASNGTLVQVDSALGTSSQTDAVIVCGGIAVAEKLDPVVASRLRRYSRRGVQLGSVCTGSVILADAGLLDGYRCTVHWEEIDSLAENYAALTVTRSLFEIDRDRFTCSGGTAPLDLMLHFITADFGRELGARVADQMLHHTARQASEPQRLALSERTGVRHPRLLDVIAAMEGNLESPLPLSDLAQAGGMSLRQMERLFMQNLATRPARYYRDLRLNRARQMVQQTGMSMIQIAVATGFTSAAHFAKAYGSLHGLPPSRDRSTAAAARNTGFEPANRRPAPGLVQDAPGTTGSQ
ncbi:MAG: GlxA family transcriptional regulator [Sphingomonadaceae bacterium]